EGTLASKKKNRGKNRKQTSPSKSNRTNSGIILFFEYIFDLLFCFCMRRRRASSAQSTSGQSLSTNLIMDSNNNSGKRIIAPLLINSGVNSTNLGVNSNGGGVYSSSMSDT